MSGSAHEISFRPATRADLKAIVMMYADDELGSGREAPGAASGELDLTVYEAAFAKIEADETTVLFVGTQGDEVVATAQLDFLYGLTYQGMTRAKLESVRVRGDLRSRGIGAQLVEWAVAQCRSRGVGMLELSSNLARTDAHRFYERLGFVKSHTGMKLDLRG